MDLIRWMHRMAKGQWRTSGIERAQQGESQMVIAARTPHERALLIRLLVRHRIFVYARQHCSNASRCHAALACSCSTIKVGWARETNAAASALAVAASAPSALEK
jgi:hypothetical protein